MSEPDRTPVLAVFGPTAAGKTALAIALGDRLRARGERPVAVSADALALYRGLEIVTGAPTAAEQAALEHRLVGVLDVAETCSAGRYARLAHAEVDGVLAADGTPIVVGGTGLYLRAALADLALRPPPDPEARARWSARVDAEGTAAVHAALAARDPAAAARIAPTDRQRIVRAHELLDAGAPVPDGDDRDELWTGRTRHPTRLIGVVRDRTDLYARIDARVDAMVAAGAEAEVRAADAAGASDTARAAVGFAELLAGDVEGMKTRTRRLAKRQLTWLRKLPDVELVDLTGTDPATAAARLLPS
jgi:tRNA dimethylallyltransferase